MTPQGRTDLGVLQEVSDFLKASSESLLDIVMANAISSYLEKHVEPHVGKVAHNMAVGSSTFFGTFFSRNQLAPIKVVQCSTRKPRIWVLPKSSLILTKTIVLRTALSPHQVRSQPTSLLCSASKTSKRSTKANPRCAHRKRSTSTRAAS